VAEKGKIKKNSLRLKLFTKLLNRSCFRAMVLGRKY